MAISVNTNVTSMKAQGNLNKAQSSTAMSMERLASGLRINSAKDDAAGLQISNRFTSQINGLGVAMRNANDGISIAQTAEGAMSESTNILQRMRDLSLQSANGSNSSADRSSMQKEISSLQDELTRIAETTSFGGQKLLDGSFGTQSFQVGSEANETIGISLKDISADKLGSYSQTLVSSGAGLGYGSALGTADVTAANGVTSSTLKVNGTVSKGIAVALGDSAKTIAASINAESAATGVNAKATTSLKIDTLALAGDITFKLNGEAVSATIADPTDLTSLAANINELTSDTGVKASIDKDGALVLVDDTGADMTIEDFTTTGTTATVSVTAVGADGEENGSAVVLSGASGSTTDSFKVAGEIELDSLQTFNTQAGDVTTGATVNITASTLTEIEKVDIGTAKGAQDAITVIDAAIAQIDSNRADLGATQNRMNFTINNLGNIQNNVSDARSRIQDVDFASESAQLSKQQILSQASSAMLAQANQLPQVALSLL
ncbi:flagellin [Shewanella livingstonensis]|uniref:Flagellin n=1 Tax=Shewanella livingstonensis TaxID=150120 RepID=A0A3G8LTV0_9GAMM|nr:flagellin [Shewanella livingstonensis]AZG72655.1 flagellin [Shewanella livingstonensis]